MTTRAGFAAIIGAPNAGKSTLTNRLVGAKVSIVTQKVQTTRFPVRGVAMAGEAQIILVDTPGIFAPRRRLDRAMVRSAWGGADDKSLVALVDKAVRERLPYDMFWVDAGWFGTDRPVAKDEFEGSDWWRTVGLWHVNRVVHPDGFRPVAAAARACPTTMSA